MFTCSNDFVSPATELSDMHAMYGSSQLSMRQEVKQSQGLQKISASFSAHNAAQIHHTVVQRQQIIVTLLNPVSGSLLRHAVVVKEV